MKSTKIALATLFALSMLIGNLAFSQPATAAPFHATSVGTVTVGSDGASYRHHHHHHRRGGVGVNIHL